METRLVKTQEERLAVFKFRYQIYVEEMQRKQHYCDHLNKTIQEPLDTTGNIFATFNEKQQIIGTIRSNYARHSDLEYYADLYQLKSVGTDYPQKVSITTKLMLSSHYRNTGVVNSIVTAAYQAGLYDGIEYDFIDTNTHLVNFFQRLGYQAMGNIVHPEYGEVTLMRLKLKDLNHLQTVGSPFYPILANYLQVGATTLAVA